jgi:hypothetical protein
MSDDISAELGGVIADAEVYDSSENFRHGKYRLLIRKVHAQRVKVEKGEHRFCFWECQVLESSPNPQNEGDRIDYVSPAQPGTGPLKDDGNNPNPKDAFVALKVNFDGNGARSAPANAQAPMLALFNKSPGQMTKEEIASTWADISRKKPVRKGEMIGFNAETRQPIVAERDMQAQMARGFIIDMTTSVKKKRDANDNGAYVMKMHWKCAAPPGTGINSIEEVAKRRAQIENGMPDDEDDDTTSASAPAGQPQMPVGAASAPPPMGVQVPATPPVPPPPPAAAPPPPPAPWAPPAPWRPHPTAAPGATPETRFFWDGAQGVKSEAQLRAGA